MRVDSSPAARPARDRQAKWCDFIVIANDINSNFTTMVSTGTINPADQGSILVQLIQGAASARCLQGVTPHCVRPNEPNFFSDFIFMMSAVLLDHKHVFAILSKKKKKIWVSKFQQ